MTAGSTKRRSAFARLTLARCVAVAYAAVILALAIHGGVYLRYAFRCVLYPFQLDYGEGIVWQQALLIPGRLMYGDITQMPFIVFHYPPLYHLAVRAIAAAGFDMLETGRALSVFCTIVTAGLIASLAHDVICQGAGRAARLTGAAIAGLTVFCYYPIVFWSPYMRVDMLASLLSVLGMWLFGRSFRRPWLLYAAVLSFVLAVYTKQSCIMAPLAVLAVSFAANRRRALLAFGAGLILGLAALLVLMEVTGGGFLRHLVLYNINRFSLAMAWSAAFRDTAPHMIFLVMALGGLAAGWRDVARTVGTGGGMTVSRLAGDARAGPLAALTLYLILSTAMLIGLGKSGAAKNYFIEWMCLWSVMIGILVASAIGQLPTHDFAAEPFAARAHRFVSMLLVPAALLVQVCILPASRNYGGDDPQMNRELDNLVTSIREAPKPVLSDDMVLLLKAGKPVLWEPAIFAELASMGRWDQQPILDMITTRAFAFIITEGNPGDLIYDSRFTPPIDRALRRYYPRAEEIGRRTVHLPPN